MRWIAPEYSKKRVRRAGELLIQPDASDQEISTAMDVLSNWRSAHAYPMHSILIFLRKKASEVDPKAVVVQRLKRTPSILWKLERFQSMMLDRMQDIGGCRAVVREVGRVEKLYQKIMYSRTRHKLHKIDNYIETPKPSGYRGIHLIYKYNGAKKQYQDYFVEIQLRSKIQHAWATAVEIVDAFTSQALKASHGDPDWLNFFLYASAELAGLESRPVGEHVNGIDTKSQLQRLSTKLNAVERLRAFTVSTDFIVGKIETKSDYFILDLSESAKEIRVTRFPSGQLEEATNEYLRREKRAVKEKDYDVVLVSASSIHNLQAAYPNYFADSRQFLSYLNRVLNDNKANSAGAKSRAAD